MNDEIKTPLYDSFRSNLNNIPFLKKTIISIDSMSERYGNDQLTLAEEVLSVAKTLQWEAEKVFTRYIFDYLKEQIAFEKFGDYGHDDFASIKESIYDNNQIMKQLYLPGLFLAYPFTSILFQKYMLFRNHFLTHLSDDMVGAEVGFGDGFYLWLVLKHLEKTKVKGYDISQPALDFCEELLKSAGVSEDRYSLQIANVFEGLPIEDSTLDWVVLAEVIEHIPNPVDAIIEAGRKLRKGGMFFLTTVIDCNHMDHISNFESPEVVSSLMTDNGFSIENEMIYRVIDDIPDSTDRAVSLGYVARKL